MDVERSWTGAAGMKGDSGAIKRDANAKGLERKQQESSTQLGYIAEQQLGKRYE